MRRRWLSRRALVLHLGLIVFVPGCLVAWWWQVTRASTGNDLSYLYAVEWPIFALIGIYLWWSLLHTDPDEVGVKAQERAVEAAMARGDLAPPPVRHPEAEDAELAAYNDRLAALGAKGPKTWRSPSGPA